MIIHTFKYIFIEFEGGTPEGTRLHFSYPLGYEKLRCRRGPTRRETVHRTVSWKSSRPFRTKTKNQTPEWASGFLVRRKGLEPLTYWFVASHSIQLSYRRIALKRLSILAQVRKKSKTFFAKNEKFFPGADQLTETGLLM